MKRDQLIKFMIAQRIKMYESIQAYGYEYKVKELQEVIDIIDGLARLEEEDTQAISLDRLMEILLNSKDDEDTEE
jgi:hypothetical protein